MGTHPMRQQGSCDPFADASRPTGPHPKRWRRNAYCIVLDRPLADAKALVDDPAAFTREMTKILLEKQSHPLIAQMIKPAGRSDPPPSNSAASSTGSHEHPSAGTPVQFQQSQTVNVESHGCHTRRVTLCNTGAVTWGIHG